MTFTFPRNQLMRALAESFVTYQTSPGLEPINIGDFSMDDTQSFLLPNCDRHLAKSQQRSTLESKS